MSHEVWTADRRLNVDKEGNVCEADDPKSEKLLINVGSTMPLDEAKRLGLVATPAVPATPAKPATIPHAVPGTAVPVKPVSPTISQTPVAPGGADTVITSTPKIAEDASKKANPAK